MNLQNKILIQNLKQSEAELKSAKEQSDETYKNLEIAESFLSREVNEFADCKGCRQTITEDDHLVWVGHWYWESSVYGLDTKVKYCKHCQIFADELPDACKKCAYSWHYGHLIKSRNEWRKARDLVEQCEEKYQNALILLITLPTWINMLVRTYAWIGILTKGGLISTILGFFGFKNVELLYTETAVLIGMVYNYLPFFSPD